MDQPESLRQQNMQEVSASHPARNESFLNPFSQITPRVGLEQKQIWAMGGGKGGVGKSMIVSNLAISLAQSGHQVIAIDLDLGGANLHTALGIDLPRQTLSDFLEKRVNSLDGCISNTHIPNLEIISGAQDHMGIANITFNDKVAILNEIQKLSADYIILDLGAGTNLNTIDFFLFADVGMLTMLPEPTSIENIYRFIKSIYYRKLNTHEDLKPIQDMISKAMDVKNTDGIKTPSDLYKKINENRPDIALKLKNLIQNFKLNLILNQARTQSDVDLGFSVKSVCKKYFGFDLDYIGYLDYDSAVWQAVRRKRPLILEFPNSQLASNLNRITQYLLRRNKDHK